ncbi:MAG: response regulator [Candidatus Competibacteraceae bacterium]|nr:response regulator [Candidatus Competibacteraceae bacterium]
MTCVVVVEDCPITSELLSALLSAEGYQVIAATDGVTGLAAARTHQPDLAVVDLHLPDISGIELTGLLPIDVPFVAMTRDRSDAAVQACIEKGALGYLVKPVDGETFLRHIAVALERGREQRNLRRALRDNHAVNQALGVLMGHLKIPEKAAFESLIACSSARNIKALILAGEILEACAVLSEAKGKKTKNTPPIPQAQAAEAFLNGFRRRSH